MKGKDVLRRDHIKQEHPAADRPDFAAVLAGGEQRYRDEHLVAARLGRYRPGEPRGAPAVIMVERRGGPRLVAAFLWAH